jgi:hypothetical protein
LEAEPLFCVINGPTRRRSSHLDGLGVAQWFEARVEPGMQMFPRALVHADLAAAAALAAAYDQRAATVREVRVIERQRLVDTQGRRQSTTTRPRKGRPWRPSPAARMTATISSTVGGS